MSRRHLYMYHCLLVPSKTETVLAFCYLIWKEGSGKCTKWISKCLKGLAQDVMHIFVMLLGIVSTWRGKKQTGFCLFVTFRNMKNICLLQNYEKCHQKILFITWPHKLMFYVFKLASWSRENWLFCYKSGLLHGCPLGLDTMIKTVNQEQVVKLNFSNGF